MSRHSLPGGSFLDFYHFPARLDSVAAGWQANGHYIKGGNALRSGTHGHQDRQQARGGVLIKRRVYEDDVESWEGEEGVDEDQKGVEGGQRDAVASSSSSRP